jgi:hypothetical protein
MVLETNQLLIAMSARDIFWGRKVKTADAKG